MIIGVVKEQSPENRVAILPEIILTLKSLKVDIIVEVGAGDQAGANDQHYTDVGAEVVAREDLLSRADLIFRYQ